MNPSSKLTHYRWVICALLFFAATINYMDRQVISILKPTLQESFQFSELDYAAIVFTFQAAYAIGLLVSGRIMDRVGVRRGFALAVGIWSIGAIAHAGANWFPWMRLPTILIDPPSIVLLTGATAGFAVARLVLGLGEAGSFPASIKTVAEWFPKKERALATGIFNSGTNVGAVVAPIAVPFITLYWGWQWAFVGTGAVGFLWVMWWLAAYRSPDEHPRVSPAELEYIRSDPPEPTVSIPWRRLIPHRQVWAFAMGKLLTDPIWWLYLFWVPDFLQRNYGLDLKASAIPLVIIYQFASVGSIAGGWMSSHLLNRGWSLNASRKTAMLICALAVVPIAFAAKVSNLWVAVGLVSLAAAAHQGWSANLFTIVSDMFPKQAVGSVVGIGGMAGSIGAMFIALVVGAILQTTGSYVPIFIIAGSAYLIALLIIQIIVPRLDPAKI